ncbi:acetate kinase, partial [Oligoflexia bacterium]|nr:acetate kinase [Oligoflexia bacterium]
EINLIILHLGNGASACAVRRGKSIDTSMGMTPLAGLIMGTRCGDLDPGIVFHLNSVTDYSAAQLDTLLNKASGLKGICGANDVRDVLERAQAGEERAVLALNMTAYRIKKYIGAYYAALNGVEAIVFTAGIGENAPEIRAKACEDLSALGIIIDSQKNLSDPGGEYEIQSDASRVKVLVIPTDEEREIAEATRFCIEAR